MCAGCVTRKTTNAERAASMKPYERMSVGSESMHNFLIARSAFLIGAEQLKVLPETKTSAMYRRNFRVQSSNVNCGTASAIRKDGYFLTAAHNIQGSAPHLAFYQDGRIQFYQSRVVWCGDVAKRRARPRSPSCSDSVEGGSSVGALRSNAGIACFCGRPRLRSGTEVQTGDAFQVRFPEWRSRTGFTRGEQPSFTVTGSCWR
jgi:hypothetical protein